MITGGAGAGVGRTITGGAWCVGLGARDTAGTAGFKVTPARRINATEFPLAIPLLAPSISRPEVSCKPEGGVPLIVSSTGLERLNAFVGMSVTVLFAGLNPAERSLSTGEFLAVNDPLLFAATNRKFAMLSAWAAFTGPLKSTTISVTW
jgi:hypothetical protein